MFGNGDDNSLDGGGNESGVAYRPFSVRHRGTVFCALVDSRGGQLRDSVGRLPGPGRHPSGSDPIYGPGTVRLANGTTQSNPLATSWRFNYATRSEGQVRNETARYLQLNLGRTIKFGRQSVDAGLGIFNVFNNGAFTQWNTNAQRINTPLYLGRFNRHPPRAFQLTLAYKF